MQQQHFSGRLFKRARTGKIQEWNIEVDNSGTFPVIVKRAGQLTGKKTEHSETVSKGKNIGRSNETTPLEQATFQAISDFKKKADEGYKHLSDLGLYIGDDGIVRTADDLVGYSSLETALDSVMPLHNTDASGNMKPMLAPTKPWKIGDKMEYPRMVQLKFDGLRSSIVITPEKIEVLSRSGKVYKNMSHLVEVLDKAHPKEHRHEKPLILDGELYMHGLTLEEINEAVKGKNENTSKMEFWIFDLPCYDAPQDMRTQQVQLIAEELDSPFFVSVDTWDVYGEDEVRERHDQAVANGFEGLMIKNPKAKYQPGQRSSDWRKVKEFDDNEYEIIGYKLGQRGAQDLSFRCKCDAGEFDAPMNGTIASKEKLVAVIDTLIGKQLTVKHFGLSKYGIPNLPKGKAIRDEA